VREVLRHRATLGEARTLHAAGVGHRNVCVFVRRAVERDRELRW